ncbi:hypothetical protein D9757_012276 [Collybiopsis confluens]|uniref:Uncharacterized protein n=1 Tax=Collybiopsis confluens TaxID=2823264 RepID=A0A8H5GPV0_9AGAR|nr:hypothetical protein D9757_012276 [Collybiopsis confluens]
MLPVALHAPCQFFCRNMILELPPLSCPSIHPFETIPIPVMIISSLVSTFQVAVDARNDTSSSNSCASCDANSSRTALDILWSCLSVLLACTWVSLHPNVPGPSEGFAIGFWRKIGLMMVTLIAPEVLVMWAARQWFAARRLVKGYRGWTKTHAFFALMGGFALYDGNKRVAVLRFVPPKSSYPDDSEEDYKKATQKILDSLENSTSESIKTSLGSPASGGYTAITPLLETSHAEEQGFNDCSFAAHETFIRRVKVEELQDRNKSDNFAKFIALGQTTWFVIQLGARWVSSLPVTELEVMTLAFASMNVLIYFFWWNKPQGVGFPIQIQRSSTNQAFDSGETDPAVSSTDGTARLSPWAEMQKSCLSFLQRRRQQQEELFDLEDDFYQGMGSVRKFLVFFLFSLAWLLLAPVIAIVNTIVEKEDTVDMQDTLPERVESFERTTALEPKHAADRLIVFGSAMVFGAIHCIAWGSQFPSNQEKILWRVCSLLVTFVPLYIGLANVFDIIYPNGDTIWGLCLFFFYVAVVLSYIFARISLILQAFLALRALHPGALETVQWTTFLPHI